MNVANSVYNLAQLNGYQGNYADAEMLYRRALAIYEKARGPNHPDVADAVDSIAYLYKDLVLGAVARRWSVGRPLTNGYSSSLPMTLPVLGSTRCTCRHAWHFTVS